MSNDSSLQGGAAQFAFDLDSQKGVTQLLASVRASGINAEQKNELRDLIFLYANGGKDQSIRLTLEQKISTYGIVPLIVVTKNSVEEIAKPKPVFGTSRPAPSFVSKAGVVGNSSTPVSVATSPQAVKEEIVKAQEVFIPNVDQVKVEESKSEEIPVPEPKTKLESVSAPAVSLVQSEVVSTPEPITPPAKAIAYDPNQALLRIREIKSLVNDKVGNPVNLVDIDNEVGREYMGALLDAMKKLNNGTSSISAMKRLETAYQIVEETIAKHEKEVIANENQNPNQSFSKDQVINTVPPLEEVTPSMPVVSDINNEALSQSFSKSETINQVATDKASAVVSREPVSVNTERTIPIVPINNLVSPQTESLNKIPTPIAVQHPLPDNLPTAKIDVKPAPSIVSNVVPRPDPAPQEIKIERVQAKEEPADSGVSAWGADRDVVTPEVKKSETGKVSSLAQSNIKLRTPDELPLASSLETSSVAGDSLFTKQVDEGLEQLLLEWSLFKKSGLFGTGPKGREHPLFKKIVSLQIPLLLAGRFEGATQEIKQSITDYMNGWRYEQGIIYEQGETFEHYLRRVIRHILDLQKK